jgi:4-diphosphocytidyl-2-C-methyl-D-erythritol kinase
VNDFEESVFALHPEIGDIKNRLYDMGATYAAMSGSGSALFGLFKEKPEHLAQAFNGIFSFCGEL